MKRVFVAAVCAAAAMSCGHAAVTGNLVVNGDAESGLTGWDFDPGISLNEPEAYEGTAAFSVGPFGSSGANSQTMTQTIDLTAYAADIATGTQTFELSAYLQSRTCCGASDSATLSISFLDENDDPTALGASVSDPTVTAPYGYDLRTLGGELSPSVRKVVLAVTFARTNFGSTDAYADNIAFSLTGSELDIDSEVPLPAALPLFGMGLALAGWKTRRKAHS
ncbi:MAG: hypothetical protein V2I43_14120 [Parvularcula sp.]|jgi:opacity protein-like surface antigen|nr:hypothetical protein [Parvularcula sp.]